MYIFAIVGRLLTTNFLIFVAGAENVLRQILRDSQIVSI
jgi:hypothetical protein